MGGEPREIQMQFAFKARLRPLGHSATRVTESLRLGLSHSGFTQQLLSCIPRFTDK